MHEHKVNLLTKLSHLLNVHFALFAINYFYLSAEAKQDLTKLLSFGFIFDQVANEVASMVLENFLKAFP